MKRDRRLSGYAVALAILLILTSCPPSLQTAAQISLQTLGFSRCQDRVARGSQMTASHVHSRLQCARDCAKMAACQVAQVRGDHSGGSVECRLLTKVTSSSDCSEWTQEVGTRSLVKKNSICGFGGVRMGSDCQCIPFVYGPECDQFLPDCHNGNLHSEAASSGWGWILPASFSEPVWTFCNFQYGIVGVLMRSPTGSNPPVPFNRTWEEYKWGFGDGVNNWWGLENVYRMMLHGNYRLEFYMNFNGSFTGVYENSVLDDESTGYSLSFTGFGSITMQSGIGDGSPRKFCTLDRDCNGCAALHQGAGWWYGPNCETGGATYPQGQMWWPRQNGTDATQPSSISFQLVLP